jgi:hypothetical protein
MELIGYCLLVAGGYLLAISLLSDLIERKAGLYKTIPESLRERYDWVGFIINYLMEVMFFVVIPTVGFAYFYLMMPLAGIRAGMMVALVALLLGAVPVVMVMSVRMKLPMPYLLFTLLSQFVKLAGSLIIVGYLYSL